MLILTFSLSFIPSLIHLFAEKQRTEDFLNFKSSQKQTPHIYDFIIGKLFYEPQEFSTRAFWIFLVNFFFLF